MYSTLADIQKRIESARHASVLAARAVTLVAVGKTKPAEAIRPLLEAGHRDFAENYVQEALEKWPALKQSFPDARLHLIGPLQSNKARDAVRLFDVIHTVDREKIAQALADEMARVGRTLPCFLQVNIGEEPQKGGIPAKALGALRACAGTLKIEGLMAVPPADIPPAPYFALLRELAERHGLQGLSMGMSADFECAIRYGATHVRVGSALFGAR